MADEELKATVRVVDQASSELGKIAQAAKDMRQSNAEAHRAEMHEARLAAMKQAEARKHAMHAAKLAKTEQHERMAQAKADQASKAAALKSLQQIQKSTRGTELAHMGSMAMGAASAFYNLASSVVRYAASIADASHKMTAQLGLYTKTSEQARQLHRELDAFGVKTGLGEEQTHKLALQLSEAGLAGDDLKMALAAAADVTAMGFDGSAIVGIQKELKQLQRLGGQFGQGMVGGAQLAEMFERTGLDKMRLARSMGFTGAEEQLNTFLANAPITIKQGMAAIERAVQDAGKEANLGDRAKQTIGPVEAAWNELSKTFKSMFEGADWAPLADAIKNITDNLRKPENVAFFAKAIKYLITALQVLAFAAEGAVMAVTTIVVAFGEMPRGLQEIGQAISEWWTGLKTSVASWFVSIGSTITGAFGGAIEAVTKAGGDIIQGFWDGLKKRWAELTAWFKGAVNQLPESVRKLLQIASPSKVMMRLGCHTSSGMAEGIEQGMPTVQAAATQLATAPASTVSNTSTSSSTSRNVVVNVTWHATDKPSSSDRAEWESMFAEVVRDLALQGA